MAYYFAIKGLKQCEFSDLTEQMRAGILKEVSADPSTIWEYYDSLNSTGHGAKGFGWSLAFIIAFLLDRNNNLTWLFQKNDSATYSPVRYSSWIRGKG